MFLLAALGIGTALAGGGPANVLILFNGADESASELADYYREARAIPAGHLCPVEGVEPSARTIAFPDYDATIRLARDTCLADLPQPEEIHTIVVVRGLPIRVDIEDGFSTSLGAMLQVGDTTVRSDGSPLAGSPQRYGGGAWAAHVQNPAWIGAGSDADYTIENPYSTHYRTAPYITADDTQPLAFSRRDMDYGGTWDFTAGLFLVSRLDGFDYTDGFDLVDRALAAEGSPPLAPITCMAAADSARGARDPECAYTIEMLDAVGIPAQWLDTHDSALAGEQMAAYLTGTTSLHNAIDDNDYAPGAFACNLTSTGAVPGNFFCDEAGTTCPESEAQTSIARFIRAGLTGAHGAVAEPLNNSFPGAGMLLLYTMGYSMVESAFFTQHYLYWQSLYLGDPLTAPWAERPVVTVGSVEELAANAPLIIDATHANSIAEIALYIDGHRVASASDTDTLSHVLEDDLSDMGLTPPVTVEVLAVAVANNAVIARPGWPAGETLPRPDVQGWSAMEITVGHPEDEPPPDDPGDTGDGAGDSGSQDVDSGEPSADTGRGPDARPKSRCGCATASVGSSPWLGLLGLLLRTRRRPAPPTHRRRRSGRTTNRRRVGPS
jgi:hypothetical protein